MRTADERMAELHRRADMETGKRAEKHRRLTVYGAFAASLALIVSLALAMPALMRRLAESEYTYVGPAASVFGNGGAVGFIVIGALAFALGVCVTVLCYRLRRRARQDKEREHD